MTLSTRSPKRGRGLGETRKKKKGKNEDKMFLGGSSRAGMNVRALRIEERGKREGESPNFQRGRDLIGEWGWQGLEKN